VVIQHYEVQAINVGLSGMRGIPRGGTAFLRCQVPNAVRDFVSVTSWLQDGSFNIYPSKEGGKNPTLTKLSLFAGFWHSKNLSLSILLHSKLSN
jgi:hypothetical protein